MKACIGNCVDDPFKYFELLSSVIENAKEINREDFLRACDVDETTKIRMRRFPKDYRYYTNGNVYFYTWSAMEFFYS